MLHWTDLYHLLRRSSDVIYSSLQNGKPLLPQDETFIVCWLSIQNFTVACFPTYHTSKCLLVQNLAWGVSRFVLSLTWGRKHCKGRWHSLAPSMRCLQGDFGRALRSNHVACFLLKRVWCADVGSLLEAVKLTSDLISRPMHKAMKIFTKEPCFCSSIQVMTELTQ